MENRFFIPITLIKNKGYTQGNVSDDIITTTLRRVQDINLQKILGTTFFKHLLDAIKNSTTTADEDTLIDDYISPYLVAQVDYRIGNHLVNEIRNKSVGRSADDQHFTTSTDSNVLKLQDDLRSDAQSYRNTLVGYLKDNCDLFETYKNYLCNFESISPDKEQDGDTVISFI